MLFWFAGCFQFWEVVDVGSFSVSGFCLCTSLLLRTSSNLSVRPFPVVRAQSVTLVGLSSLLLIFSPSCFPLLSVSFFLKSPSWFLALRSLANL